MFLTLLIKKKVFFCTKLSYFNYLWGITWQNKFSFASTGINYILKYITIENCNITQNMTNILVWKWVLPVHSVGLHPAESVFIHSQHELQATSDALNVLGALWGSEGKIHIHDTHTHTHTHTHKLACTQTQKGQHDQNTKNRIVQISREMDAWNNKPVLSKC